MSWIGDTSHKVLQATHGRTTAFFIAFFISGTTLAFLGRLTPVYVAFMGTLGGLVISHSVKEDLMQLKNQAMGGQAPERGHDDK